MDQIYRHSPLSILESRLDWVTVTVRPGNRQLVLKGRAHLWMEDEVKRGSTRQAFKNPFYTGERAGGVTWGEREDDSMLVLSGVCAGRWGPIAVTWADNVSRLDVQVTTVDPDLSHDWAGYVDRLAALVPQVQSGELHTRLIRSRPDGVTCYIGSGRSDRMLRMYDKYAESGHVYPPGSWRWEVQYRHTRANSVANNLLQATSKPAACLGVVCSAYLAYGITLPAICLPLNWSDAGITTPTDNDRRMDWLRRSVAPAIVKLHERYSTEDILDALGLVSVIDTLEGQRAALEAAFDILADVSDGAQILAPSPGSQLESLLLN